MMIIRAIEPQAKSASTSVSHPCFSGFLNWMRFVFLCSLDSQMEGTLGVIKFNGLPNLSACLWNFPVGHPVTTNIPVVARNSWPLKTSLAEVKDSEWSFTLLG